MPNRKLAANTTGKVAPQAEIQAGAGSWTERVKDADEWERRHEEEWARIDQKLRGIAARRAALDAEEANLLRYAEELKLWRAFGFGSLLEYMERAMGYAPHTATERLRVARSLAELPLLAEALERGELAHSAVRELSRVAVPETEATWLEAVQDKSLREVEAMVSGHRPGDLPTDPTEPRLHRRAITLELSPETYDLWRKLHALAAEEHGQRLSDDELIQALFRRAYGAAPSTASTASTASTTSTASTAGTASTVSNPNIAGTASTASTASTAAAPAAPGTASTASNPNTAGTASTASTAATPASPGASSASAVNSSVGAPAASSALVTIGAAAGVSDISGASGASGAPAAHGACGSPAYKIALKQCPDCKRSWQFTGGRDIEVDPAVLELATCDAVHLGSLDVAAPERATTTVTPRKREQVLARDGHCCTVPGCRRNVGLDLHHITYQSHGGDHALRNITTLCDLHHRAVHFKKLVIRGTAPDQLTFEFRKPRDRRNITDDDAPALSTAAAPSAEASRPGALIERHPLGGSSHVEV